MKLDFTPSEGQSAESVERDIYGSVKLAADLAARGAKQWSSRYRWVGPVKVMVVKEVGPPPWRFPKVLVKKTGPHANLCVGWRSTAYYLHLMWAGSRK